MESDTPRTDEKAWTTRTQFEVVHASLARQLERELAAAIKQRDEARREVCLHDAYQRAKVIGLFDPKRVAAERGWDCFSEGGWAC